MRARWLLGPSLVAALSASATVAHADPPPDMGADPTPLPPPPPPPWHTNIPTSTHGPALITPEPPTPVAAPPVAPKDTALEDRVKVLEGRADASEKKVHDL